MSKESVSSTCHEPAALTELDASLNTSALGLEALMDLMAHAPAEHRVRTVALHALMLTVSDQLGQANEALRVVLTQADGPLSTG